MQHPTSSRWSTELDGFSQYIKDILRYPLLSKQQEILLARQVREWVSTENPTPKQAKVGQRAYHKLINCNLRLVVSIAKRYTPSCTMSNISPTCMGRIPLGNRYHQTEVAVDELVISPLPNLCLLWGGVFSVDPLPDLTCQQNFLLLT